MLCLSHRADFHWQFWISWLYCLVSNLLQLNLRCSPILAFLLENCCLSEAWNVWSGPQHSCYIRALREQNLMASFSMGQGIKMVWNQSWGMISMHDGMAFLFSLSKSSLASGEWALGFTWSCKCRSNFGSPFPCAHQYLCTKWHKDCGKQMEHYRGDNPGNSKRQTGSNDGKHSWEASVYPAHSNQEINANPCSMTKCAFPISYSLALPS